MIEEPKDEIQSQMGELKTEEKPEVKKTKPKKITAKKVTKTKTKANGGADLVTLKILAKDYKMATPVARRKLRLAGLKPEGRWAWEKGSASLKKAEAALSASAK